MGERDISASQVTVEEIIADLRRFTDLILTRDGDFSRERSSLLREQTALIARTMSLAAASLREYKAAVNNPSPETYRQAWEEERRKFQQETRRTSELYQVLDNGIKLLEVNGHTTWMPKHCNLCQWMRDAVELMRSPITNPVQEAKPMTREPVATTSLEAEQEAHIFRPGPLKERG